MEQPNKIFTKDYIIVVLYFIVSMLIISMYMPTMALYSKVISNSDTWAGYMPGAFTVTCMISRFIAVPIIARLGKSRTMLLGSCICIIASLLYLVANSIPMLLLARFVQGLGNGIATTPTTAAIADILPKERLMEGIGYYSMAMTAVSAIAPAMALSVVESGKDGFRKVFLFALICGVFNLIISMFVTYEKKPWYIEKSKRELPSSSETKRKKMTKQEAEAAGLKLFCGIEKILLLPIAMLFFYSCCINLVNSYLSLSAKERDLGSIALFYTISAIVVFIARLAVNKVADKRGVAVLLIPAFIIMAFAESIIGLAKSAKLIMAMAVPFGIASGISGPTINGLFFQLGAPGRNSETSAVYSVSTDLSGFLCSLIIGTIAGFTGYTPMYFGGTCLAVIALLIFLVQNRQAKKYLAARKERENSAKATV